MTIHFPTPTMTVGSATNMLRHLGLVEFIPTFRRRRDKSHCRALKEAGLVSTSFMQTFLRDVARHQGDEEYQWKEFSVFAPSQNPSMIQD